jgi:cytochrome c
MTDRFNTIAGWTLFAGIVALGLSIVSGMYFGADKPHRPEQMGFPIEGVVEEGAADEGPPLATLLATGDAAAGEKTFAKCTSCHTINQGGANGIGPNLYGIFGQPVGKHAAGFAYSSDLVALGGQWTYELMDQWLKSPKGLVPGTKMSFAGLGNPQERANVMLYLLQNGGGPPLPAPPAAEAPAEGEAAAAEGDPTAAAGPAEAPGPEAAGAVASENPAGGLVRQQSQTE